MSSSEDIQQQQDTQGSQFFINRPTGPVHQHFGDTVGGDKISGDIQASDIPGKGIAIGHGAQATVYEDPDYPHDVRGLENPYLGLRPFTYDDRAIYAGRKRDIDQAVEKLTTPGEQRVILFITGASGSGKSSLAQAGLLPALEYHYEQRNLTPRRAVFRPSKQPMAMLADAMQQLGIPVERLSFEAIQEEPSRWHHFVAHTTPANQVNLLVIDQFEELFTQSEPTQRDTLFAILEQMPAFERMRTHIIITLRSDYLPELFQQKLLYEEGKRGIDLRVMEADAIKETIQRPLQQHPKSGGKCFEPALLDQLATDAAENAAYLPLLQVTLARIWGGGVLKLSAYGTLTDAIQQQAEDVYKTHPDGTPRPAEEQQTMMSLLLELVDVSPMDDDRRDVRRRRTLSELLHNAPDRRPLITELATTRLLSTGHEKRNGSEVEVVDIIHESLLSNWKGLHDAINEARETLQQRAHFELSLSEWQENERHDRYLLAGVRLAEAQALAEQGDVALRSTDAQELLRRSVARREHQRRVIVGASLAAVVVFAVLAVVAGWFGVLAQERQRKAEELLQIATSRQLATQSVSQREQDINLSLLLAVQADNEASTLESKSALLESLSSSSNLITTQRGFSYSLSPDGQTLVSKSLDGTIILHVTGQHPKTLKGHTDVVYSLVWSPNGKVLASASLDKTVRLWRVSDGHLLNTFEEHVKEDDVAIVWSPDGETLASASCGEYNERNRCVKGEIILWDVATGHILHTLRGHTSLVNSIAWSPDGETLASAGDITVRLWRVSDGQPLRTIHEHTSSVWSVAWSPDGETLASASSDNTVRLWRVSDGQPLHILTGHRNNHSVMWWPNGETLIAKNREGTIMLWDVKTEQPIGEPLYDDVLSVALSPDGKILALIENNKIHLWNVETGQSIGEPLKKHNGDVRCLKFSPDGQILVSGGEDEKIILWDITTRQPIGEPLRGHSSYVVSIAFSPDGQILASGSYDGTVRLWNVTTGQPLKEALRGHTKWVTQVFFALDGQILVSSGNDGTVRLWNVDEKIPIGEPLKGYKNAIMNLAFSPDGQTLASVTWGDNKIRLWDVATGQPIGEPLKGHTEDVNSVAFSKDGLTLVSGSSDEKNILWDVATRQPIGEPLKGHTDSVWSVAFSIEEQIFASGSADGTVRLWDVATRQPIGEPLGSTRSDVWSVAFSPDGQTLASASDKTTVQLWRVSDGQPLRTLDGHTSDVRSVAWSPNGQTLASGSSDDTIILWDIVTGQPIGVPLQGHTETVNSVLFSIDGKTLISGSDDYTIRLWDIETGQPIGASLHGHTHIVNSVALSPDGKRVASGSWDGNIILWDVSIASWKARACYKVNRNLTLSEWQQYLGDRPYERTCPDLPPGEGGEDIEEQ